ncbi:DNRLRE domain-containing protein [Streptomyces luteolifulvus]|uniref:DNRLRE domain-containing protein n=1 Tax=Streptomyces luteolifulvus TaxID=2615112 RepID=A0A6H9UX83_9ACTN|nr:DNRLRE domain-containing protein [Streptomyces luteolifulvus]KAB1143520.1 DNRLRE domain-containing protein [Streptomyces luteolifulvus]
MGSRHIRRASTATAAVATTTAAVAALLTTAPTATAATTTINPTADTYVQDSTPTTNYGTSSQFTVDNSPVRQSFLKFTVSGLTETVASAKLRIRVTNSGNSSNGGTWKSMADTTWTETGVTWNNKPVINGATVASLGSVANDQWVEIDVTSVVTGNGTFSFGGTSTSTNGAYYDSRESGADAPQLVITTGTAPSPTPTTSTPPPSGDPVLVGAGDIANCGTGGDEATASLLDGITGTVMAIGDTAYPDGTSSDYTNCYQPSWGRHKARTKPATGNHEYHTTGASGYFNYFGASAGDPSKGYYSFDLGTWHVVALNSNCSIVSCSAGSAQEQWLRNDLAASTKPCTVAYWHHPRYTSGSSHGPNTAVQPLYQALYDNDAEVIVTGHNHNYERFAPMNATGGLDNTRGIRQFVAGMGGTGLGGFGTIQPNSEVRNSSTWGVLKLTLHSGSYDWQFVPQAGKTFTDSGTNACH